MLAEQLDIPATLVRLAITFAAAHPDEITEMIKRNDATAAQAQRAVRERERFLAS